MSPVPIFGRRSDGEAHEQSGDERVDLHQVSVDTADIAHQVADAVDVVDHHLVDQQLRHLGEVRLIRVDGVLAVHRAAVPEQPEHVDRPDHPLVEIPLEILHSRQVPPHLQHHEADAGLGAEGRDLAALVDGSGQRLLAEHVDAPAGGQAGERLVAVRPGGDVHAVQVLGRQHLLDAGVDGRNTELPGSLLSAGAVQIADGHQLGVWCSLPGWDVSLDDEAGPDQAGAQRWRRTHMRSRGDRVQGTEQVIGVRPSVPCNLSSIP
jgi:hypothetical protein